jgi:hypothetical protein
MCGKAGKEANVEERARIETFGRLIKDLEGGRRRVTRIPKRDS